MIFHIISDIQSIRRYYNKVMYSGMFSTKIRNLIYIWCCVERDKWNIIKKIKLSCDLKKLKTSFSCIATKTIVHLSIIKLYCHNFFPPLFFFFLSIPPIWNNCCDKGAFLLQHGSSPCSNFTTIFYMFWLTAIEQSLAIGLKW